MTVGVGVYRREKEEEEGGGAIKVMTGKEPIPTVSDLLQSGVLGERH